MEYLEWQLDADLGCEFCQKPAGAENGHPVRGCECDWETEYITWWNSIATKWSEQFSEATLVEEEEEDAERAQEMGSSKLTGEWMNWV